MQARLRQKLTKWEGVLSGNIKRMSQGIQMCSPRIFHLSIEKYIRKQCKETLYSLFLVTFLVLFPQQGSPLETQIVTSQDLHEQVLVETGTVKHERTIITPGDLVGTWVLRSALRRLADTQSAYRSQTFQITIEHVKEGIPRLQITDFHEGLSYYLQEVRGPTEPNRYELILLQPSYDAFSANVSSKDPYEQVLRLPVNIKSNASGNVETITLLNRKLMGATINEPYVRIPIPWQQYVNQSLLAGTWTDENQGKIVFQEDGKFRNWNGQSTTYDVVLDTVGAGCDFLEFAHPVSFQAADRPERFFGFARSEATLAVFYSLNTSLALSDCPGTHPFLTFKEE